MPGDGSCPRAMIVSPRHNPSAGYPAVEEGAGGGVVPPVGRPVVASVIPTDAKRSGRIVPGMYAAKRRSLGKTRDNEA